MTIDELAALHAARKDRLDLPGSMTFRDVAAYVSETRVLTQRLTSARTAAATITEVDAALDADQTWMTHLNTWRKVLCDELLAIKSPIRDPLVKERCDNIAWSLKVVDFGLGASTLGPVVKLAARIGDLMQAAGYEVEAPGLHGPRGWRGSLKEVERRVAALTKRRTEAQAVLSESLLSDTERATRDTERAALSETLNTMQIRGNTGGTGFVALTKDGDPLAVEDMTPAQRAAFERFEAAAYPPRETVTS